MPSESTTLSASDFDYIRTLAKENAAIVIEREKRYLVESRLSPLAEKEGFHSLQALIEALRKAPGMSSLKVKAIEALATHETLFFRDRHPFDALAGCIFSELIGLRREQKRLRIWSAAASTGQEAYSVAMILREQFPELRSWDLSIIGTDISEIVLEKARSGCYSQHEVSRGLSASLLIRNFTQNGDRWTIKPEIRRMVQFQCMNLIGPWAGMPKFDLTLIRNVLIYFDDETKRQILSEVASCLAPDGYM